MYRRGFTIIEILIVITTMAILASIGVVSYQYVTNGARKTATEKNVVDFKKALETYALKNGKYPNTNPNLSYGITCLGTPQNYGWDANPQPCYDFLGKNGYSPVNQADLKSSTNQTALDLQPILGNIPVVGTECYMFQGECARGLSLVRSIAGVDYVKTPNFIVYFFKGNGKCEVSGSLGGNFSRFSSTLNDGKNYKYDSTSDVTMCVVSLPNAYKDDFGCFIC